MSSPYAADKAVLHMDRLLKIHSGEQPAPVHLHFIISDLCNQDCSFCAYRIENYTESFSVIEADGTRNHNPNRMIPFDKAVEILEDFEGMGGKAVQFTGGGEPTVHPQCAQIMQRALDLGLDVALVTNGVRLPLVLPQLMSAKWTRISIDAAHQETYCAVRHVPSGHWDKVLANVRSLVAARLDATRPLTIGIGFVVTKENWGEVVDGARLARDLGADNMRISAMFQPDDDHYFAEFHDEAVALCAEAETISGNGFTVINNFGTRLSDLELHSPDYKRCGYQNFTTYIGGDMNLYRCCVLSYTERGAIGSLKSQRFRDLWESQSKHDDFARFDARSCPRCQFNDKNRAINHLINTLPVTHGNFV
jgi:MoaA/NifB/PqqE/SkfB family radical SAM enzyme